MTWKKRNKFVWENKDGEKIAVSRFGNKFIVFKFYEGTNDAITLKQFGSRTQAMSFAQSYMRKH